MKPWIKIERIPGPLASAYEKATCLAINIYYSNRVLKCGGQAWIYDPAKIALYIDRNKWRTSLTKRELFHLWVFTSLGLLRPIKTYARDQVVEMIGDIDYEIISIDEGKDEIRIRLRK
jgi:hypothetical protein